MASSIAGETETPSDSPTQPRRLRRLAVPAAVVSLTPALLGLAVRLTVRDQAAALAVVYYALPAVVIGALALLAAALFRVGGRRRMARASALAGVACIVWWCGSTYTHHAPRQSDEAHRVLFWNTARGALGWESLAEEVRRFDAELVGLVEAGTNRDQAMVNWQRPFPEFAVRYLGRGFVLLVKGDVLHTDNGSLAGAGRYGLAHVRLAERPLTVVIVDIRSTLSVSRRPALESLAQLVEEWDDGPVLVMGDFNTPIDSVHLAELRRRCVNGFETAGSGMHVTWPVPIPVLAIDQMWANSLLSFDECRLEWSWRSDHRPIVARVRFQPPEAVEPAGS